MNLLVITLFSLSCSKTIIVNTTKYPWNSFDQKTLNQAKKRCGEIYPNAPCVKWFKKYGSIDYSIICGNIN